MFRLTSLGPADISAAATRSRVGVRPGWRSAALWTSFSEARRRGEVVGQLGVDLVRVRAQGSSRASAAAASKAPGRVDSPRREGGTRAACSVRA